MRLDLRQADMGRDGILRRAAAISAYLCGPGSAGDTAAFYHVLMPRTLRKQGLIAVVWSAHNQMRHVWRRWPQLKPVPKADSAC